ncbi:MAG: S41 family peptidase [Candidatus Acidiferrales bacterium]
MNRFGRILVVSLSMVVFCYAGLGYLLGKSEEDKTYRSLTVYGEVLQNIQDSYVDEPNLQLVTSGALHGLLESLDPQSAYMSPREYTDYKDKTKNQARGDVGLTLSKRYGYIYVVSELPDSPAEKAGIRSGDILEAIGGFATREMAVAQASLLLQGAPGTTVKVGALRRNQTEPDEIELTRATLPLLYVDADKVTDDTAYLRLATLDLGAAADLRFKLQQLQSQGAQKLVLDLRGCAEGPISEGIAAAQLFLTSGTITTLSGQTVAKQDFEADPSKVVWRNPVEVLISSDTAGAAEVLAAAIGENKRGDLVGEHTAGLAAEQRLIPLDDGAALILTDALYNTPAGKAILDDGVAPTVEVVPPLDESDEEQVEPPPPLSVGQLPAKDDPVYNKALDLLKGARQKAA